MAEKKQKDILIYDIIGGSWWEDGTTAVPFLNELKQAEREADVINIRINSPGGSMYHGMAIFNAIKNSKSEIHLYNDGVAYSMAAMLFFAVKKENAHFAKNSLFLLHNSLITLVGQFNAGDLQSYANDMVKYDETLIQCIANRQDQDIEKIRKDYFDYNDHLFTAQEAVDLGFGTLEETEGNIAQNLKDIGNFRDFVRKEILSSKQPESIVDSILGRIKGLFNLKHTNTNNLLNHTTMAQPIKSLAVLAAACGMGEFLCNDSGKVELSIDQLIQLDNMVKEMNQAKVDAKTTQTDHEKAIEAKNGEIAELNAKITALNEKLSKTPVDTGKSNLVDNNTEVDAFQQESKNFAHNKDAEEYISKYR